MRTSTRFLLAASVFIGASAAILAYSPPASVASAPSKLTQPLDGHEFDDIFSRPLLKKSSQLKFLIFIADGPGNGTVEGPMSRIQADAEMKLYADADAVLMVEDGHGGYIDAKSRQPMQNLLAARDPDWNK